MQRVERRQTHVYVLVIVHGVQQRGKHLRIVLWDAIAPIHALQPLAGRLLLQKRERHQLPRVANLLAQPGYFPLASRVLRERTANQQPYRQKYYGEAELKGRLARPPAVQPLIQLFTGRWTALGLPQALYVGLDRGFEAGTQS